LQAVLLAGVAAAKVIDLGHQRAPWLGHAR
jgi:hypothetical protein